MILVTLGTQDKSFKRLLLALEEAKRNGQIEDEIVVQAGFTKFHSEHLRVKDYFSQLELDELRKSADLIITHAGVGSILDALKFKKTVIGVARLKQFEEHANDHQLEILNTFFNEGYILKAEKLEELPQLIRVARSFIPKPYPFDNSVILKTVQNFIDSH